jgi:hypothetical protein
MMVGAATGVVVDDVDRAYPHVIAFRRTCAVSRLGMGRFSVGPYSDMPTLDMLRTMVGTVVLSPVLDGTGAARGHHLRTLGLAAGPLDRNELGLSSW